MNYEFFGGWHRHYKQPVEPLTEMEARERELKKEGYCVAVRDDSNGYYAFIEIGSNFFSVNFLDKSTRVYLTYAFEDKGQDRLFLKQARHFEFEEQDSGPVRTTSYYFDERGAVTIERSSKQPPGHELAEKEVSVASNWEGRPAFGDYRNLLVKERLLPAGRPS